MRGGDAAKVCPGIRLVTVPVANEKADLTCYREAGTAVFELLSAQGAVTERTSIDEVPYSLCPPMPPFVSPCPPW